MIKQKLYKAYGSYGRHKLQDTSILEMVSQNRKRWQGKPVCKLYVRKRVDKGVHCDKTFLIKAFVDAGMTYEVACIAADELFK